MADWDYVDNILNKRWAKVPAHEVALFEFLDKLNRSFERPVTQADIDCLKAKNLTDDAIFTAITVCSLFNFYNRWCDGNGVHPLTPEGYEQSGHQLATRGYLLK